MYDPLMRVLTVLELLQAKERVSGPELARRLEVSPRTVQRYVARLQDLGVPVEGKPGVGGAYRLRPGFRLPPLMFSDEEAFALALGLRALRRLVLSDFVPAAEGASAKLARVLPERVRHRLLDVEEAVQLDDEMTGWKVPAEAEALIEAAAAIRARQRLTFLYRAQDGSSSEREIEPYGAVHLDGRWYLLGRCLSRQALRTFRLDRTSGLHRAEDCPADSFERPADFDAAAYLQTSLAFVTAPHTVSLWLDMPLAKAEQICRHWRVSLTEETGGTRLRCTRQDLERFAAGVLGLGCAIRVEEPPALVATFARLAARAAMAAGLDVPAGSEDPASESPRPGDLLYSSAMKP